MFGALASAMYVAPYLAQGTRTRIAALDNLDSNWVWFVLKHRDNSLFTFGGSISGILGGVPAEATGSDLFVPSLLVHAFGLFPAYVLNQLVIRIVAYWGMARVLERLLGRTQRMPMLAAAVAFAWIPFWPPGGLSIAGLPLLASGYLSIRAGRARRSDWIILGALPFYSLFIAIGPFVVVCALVDIVVVAARRHRIPWHPIAAAMTYLGAFMVVEAETIYSAIFDGWDASRADQQNPGLPVGRVLEDVYTRIAHGTIHTQAAQGLVLFATIGFCLAASLIRGDQRQRRRVMALAMAAAVGLTALASTSDWRPIADARDNLGLGGSLNWRFDWLAPPLLYIALAAAFAYLCSIDPRRGKAVVGALLVVQLSAAVSMAEWRDQENLSFEAFFAEDVFDQITADLQLGPGQRVGSVGMHPSIAHYNGLATVDGYLPIYPLAYKRSFRRVIAAELERDDALRRYFDDWGSRAYLFSHELVPRPSRPSLNPTAATLRLNTRALRDLGGRFLLSSVVITNAGELGLQLRGEYESSKSPWIVRVYEIVWAESPTPT